MASRSTDLKQHAHELIDRMAPGQIAAAVDMLEIVVDPFVHSLAPAPYDDEPVRADEAREVKASKAQLDRGEGISHAEVLADFGLSPADFEEMGRTPLKQAESYR
jgi:hypothetical protein